MTVTTLLYCRGQVKPSGKPNQLNCRKHANGVLFSAAASRPENNSKSATTEEIATLICRGEGAATPLEHNPGAETDERWYQRLEPHHRQRQTRHYR